MATDRSYHDMCGMAHALDLVGERWALLVVRELALGPKRYTDLRSDLPGISTNVLSHRLTELERAGVLRRRTLPPPAASAVYELTPWGQELEPIMCALGRWGARSPARPADGSFSLNALVLSLRTTFSPEAARDVAVTVELRLGQRPVRAEIAGAALNVELGEADGPDVVVEADEPAAVAAVLYGGVPLGDAVRAGTVRVEGAHDAAARFLRAFVLPEPAFALTD
ncbi:winged helix-turn-helix transcriptional regulator [Prauserella muralis]|uniref:Transcriptional regulator n=1 Tax=Prauserella muralis TaxID=588067 RepID=A0A2V4AKN2_9PSEU|nr:winged helix-turn-helix transcriptional regulator [Prauserella muralis]PXY19403.1 transcriptional regulator [Prauserella muralis]TWE29377.1 HxlR family transcriptional regulator [Prauserella muralis]